MTLTKPKTHCSICQDKDYVLENKSGRLHAEACECFQCENCDGNGKQFNQDDHGQSFLMPCKCADFRRKLRLINESGLPGKFIEAELDNYETNKPMHSSQKRAKSRAKDFLKDFGKKGKTPQRGLAFIGGPGLGKTHLASAIVKSLILDQGVDCRFVDFFQLLGEIRHAYSEERSDQNLIRPYIEARVLVIDELAKGRNNEWERTVLDQFISSRYNSANKLTLFTSNFNNHSNGKDSKNFSSGHVDTDRTRQSIQKESLQERIGDRIHSRLVEMCDFIVMQGPDYRVISKPHSHK
jgi:DNA replication protein DnaC